MTTRPEPFSSTIMNGLLTTDGVSNGQNLFPDPLHPLVICSHGKRLPNRSFLKFGMYSTISHPARSPAHSCRLANRSAVVTRLFYHASRILLAKTHPFQSEFDEDMRKMQRNHAHEMCGLIARTTDRLVQIMTKIPEMSVSNQANRGVAHISMYFLVLAAECLETREAQEEVLGIFDTLSKVTGSSAEIIKNDLKQIWSWVDAHPHTVTPAQMHNDFYELDPSLPISPHPGSSPSLHNPLLTTGDFSLENHPYQGYYVPPHHHHALNQYHYGSFDLI